MQDLVRKKVEEQLEKDGSLCISLFHKYPVFQHRSEFLKGVDHEIFETLNDFNVKIVPIALHFDIWDDTEVKGSFYRHKLKEGVTLPALFMPNGVYQDSMIRFVEGALNVGNQSQREIQCYLSTVLMVTRKGNDFLEDGVYDEHEWDPHTGTGIDSFFR